MDQYNEGRFVINVVVRRYTLIYILAAKTATIKYSPRALGKLSALHNAVIFVRSVFLSEIIV